MARNVGGDDPKSRLGLAHGLQLLQHELQSTSRKDFTSLLVKTWAFTITMQGFSYACVALMAIVLKRIPEGDDCEEQLQTSPPRDLAIEN